MAMKPPYYSIKHLAEVWGATEKVVLESLHSFSFTSISITAHLENISIRKDPYLAPVVKSTEDVRIYGDLLTEIIHSGKGYFCNHSKRQYCRIKNNGTIDRKGFLITASELLVARKDAELFAKMEELPDPSGRQQEAKKQIPDNKPEQKVFNKGGRPPGTLTRALELLINYKVEQYVAKVLENGSERDLISELKEIIKDSSDHPLSPKLQELIAAVTLPRDGFSVKTQEVVTQTPGGKEMIEKSKRYEKDKIVAKIRAIRKKYTSHTK